MAKNLESKVHDLDVEPTFVQQGLERFDPSKVDLTKIPDSALAWERLMNDLRSRLLAPDIQLQIPTTEIESAHEEIEQASEEIRVITRPAQPLIPGEYYLAPFDGYQWVTSETPTPVRRSEGLIDLDRLQEMRSQLEMQRRGAMEGNQRTRLDRLPSRSRRQR